jgi:CRP-like cAMP-binding protein
MCPRFRSVTRGAPRLCSGNTRLFHLRYAPYRIRHVGARTWPSAFVTHREQGRGLFVVLSGEIDVSRKTADGEIVPLGGLRTGDVFGEMAVLRNAPTTQLGHISVSHLSPGRPVTDGTVRASGAREEELVKYVRRFSVLPATR